MTEFGGGGSNYAATTSGGPSAMSPEDMSAKKTRLSSCQRVVAALAFVMFIVFLLLTCGGLAVFLLGWYNK